MSDWAAVVSTLATLGGLLFAGWQIGLLRQDRQEERRLALEGVSVEWHPRVRPDQTDVGARRDGSLAIQVQS
jgi:hypothetical protein